MKFVHVDDGCEIYEVASIYLAKSIVSYLKKDQQVALYLSGGSSIKLYDLLLQELVDKTRDTNLLADIIFMIVDERIFLDADPEDDKLMVQINSYRFLQETGIKEFCQNYGANYNFLEYLGGDYNDTIDQYIRALNKLEQRSDVVDIAILGIGDDYHTAGIKPMSDLKKFIDLFDSEKKFVTYNADDFPTRATISLSKIRSVSEIFVVLTGEEKRLVYEYLKDAYKLTESELKESINQKPVNALVNLDNVRVFCDYE